MRDDWKVEATSGQVAALRLMCRLRTAILLGTTATALAGWAWQSPTLVALAVVVAAEEMLEAAVVIGALRGTGLRRP